MTVSSPSGAEPGSVGGPGRLEVVGEQGSVLLRRRFHHPIEEVWRAITDPAELAAWFMVRVTREGPEGEQILRMEHPNGVRATGRVLEWRPPRLYRYEWNLPPGPNHPLGEASIVQYELTPEKEGTLLVLTHRNLTRSTAEVFSRGLVSFLDRLGAHLDRRPLPDPPWLARADRPIPPGATP